MRKTYVIIVSYNGMEWLPKCLETLSCSSLPVDIIVVDNNSVDESVSFIRQKHEEIIVFEQQKNLGFGVANNIGMSYALKHGADYVFLLNQDTQVQPDTIQKLIDAAQNNPEYGIISPIQLDFSGKALEDCFYFFMSEQGDKSFYSDAVLGKPRQDVYTVRFVQAAAWLLPRKTLLTIGGFDPIFYHYGEDNNYCFRVLFHSLKIGVCSTSLIQHDSTAKLSVQAPLFSDKYFEDYKRSILFKYCNINNDIGDFEMKIENRKNMVSSLKSLLKLNLFHAKGYFEKVRILRSQRHAIIESRKINMQKKSNYL